MKYLITVLNRIVKPSGKRSGSHGKKLHAREYATWFHRTKKTKARGEAVELSSLH